MLMPERTGSRFSRTAPAVAVTESVPSLMVAVQARVSPGAKLPSGVVSAPAVPLLQANAISRVSDGSASVAVPVQVKTASL